MILCLVSLGRQHEQKSFCQKRGDLVSEDRDSLYVPKGVTFSKHEEFIVFKEAACLPSYIVVYRYG